MTEEGQIENGEKSLPSVKPNGVNLDAILEEVGQIGRYQITTLLLAVFPIVFAAFAAGEYIFTTARIPTRCLIPECDGSNPEFAPSWKENAIPLTNSGFDNCARFANSSETNIDSCPATLFDRSRTENCKEYVYENTNSIVYDFSLACDEWRRSQIGTIRTIGTVLSLPITGYISDRWGRRVALALNGFNMGWIGLVRSFVNSYEWFVALEVIESCFGSGAFPSMYILVLELVGSKYRVIAGATIFTQFALGQVILGLIAWLVQPWRTLTQVLYVPQLFIICYFWILPESVRWLMSKGRFEKSKKILMKVAKTNKKELSPKSLEGFLLNETLTKPEKATETEEKPKWLVTQVIKSKSLLFRVCVSPVWWITNSLVYYGLNINSVNLVGNSYLNYMAVAAVEIPGYWTAILLLDRVGRKPVLICGYWLCAVCQFTFAFLPEGYDGLSTAVYLIAKYCIAVVVTSMYLYTAELYPTKYRQRLFAFSSMIGRVGSFTAPLTPSLATEVWGPLPSVMFGSAALISGGFLFAMPETLGTKLPDTIKDAEEMKQTTESK